VGIEIVHTFLKLGDGTYSIGMWLPNQNGITSFVPLFTVLGIAQAIRAVNVMNGGDKPITAVSNDILEEA